MERKISHIIGIDEAGRGPLAGPVAVGVVMVPYDFDWNQIPGVYDSKKVSEKNREAIFTRTEELSKNGALVFEVTLISPKVIDTKGITKAVHFGIEKSLKIIAPNPHKTQILLDGLLKAPEEFLFQETIIKGDSKEKAIGLASILAKVTRDRYMVSYSHQYSQYGFEMHKGYGTKYHREKIIFHGPCALHRHTFLKNIRGTP